MASGYATSIKVAESEPRMGRGNGIMGKFGYWGILVLFALFAYSTAWAKKPKLARVLPSRVKTIHLVPTRASKRVAKATAASPAGSFSPELTTEAAAAPYASKYFSRTVYYVRSASRLPAEYNCDEETQARKLHEAETQALEKCAAAGDPCRIAKSVISRNDELRCRDFPGAHCPASGHFRGCVAEALALGGKDVVDAPADETESAPSPEDVQPVAAAVF
jgi:hypothetical protein